MIIIRRAQFSCKGSAVARRTVDRLSPATRPSGFSEPKIGGIMAHVHDELWNGRVPFMDYLRFMFWGLSRASSASSMSGTKFGYG